MRIAWFTPLSKRTGISKYSLFAVNALSRRVSLDVWTTTDRDNITIEGVNIYETVLNDENIRKLKTYDVVIYNMGNNIDFHFEIFECYRRVKGIVILHDKIMHHFTAGYYLDKLKKPDRYVSLMNYYYGDEGKKAADQSLRYPPPVWETEEVMKYPLFEHILYNSCGVIVHSRETLGLISDHTGPAPSACIYLPFSVPDYEYGNKPLLSKSDLNLPVEKTVLLSFGTVNMNKKIDSVLRVIGESTHLIQRVYFVIAGKGSPDYIQYLKKLITRYRLQNIVRFTGFVDDNTLHSYLQNADICINLRYPSTESGSASLIEQLSFQKPVIVTRIGFYDELPDNALIKIDLHDMEKGLESEMNHLIEDTSYRERKALEGYRFASENCSPELYADNFLEFLNTAVSERGYIDFLDQVTDEISSFVKPGTSEYFIDNISSEINAISGINDQDDDLMNGAADGLDDIQYAGGWSKSIYGYQQSLKERFVNFGWRHRETLKKIPLLNSLSRKIYHSHLHN